MTSECVYDPCAYVVTLARALELKHKPSVIYSLAVETSKIFTVAGRWSYMYNKVCSLFCGI